MRARSRTASDGHLPARERSRAPLLIALAVLVAGALPPALARAGAFSPSAAPTTPAPTPAQTAAPTTPAGAAVLSLTATPARVAAGATVTVSVQLRGAADGAPLGGQPVELWAAPARTTAWARIGAVTTGADGRATARHRPTGHTDLRATVAAAPTSSAVHRVDVAARVQAALSAPAVRAGTPAVVAGSVVPAQTGRPVTLWVRSGGAWRSRATTPQSAAGAFRFAVTPTAPGFWRYRVTVSGDATVLPGEQALPALDAYRLHTYVVSRRGTPGTDLEAFAATVAATYADPRGWRAAHRRFSRVASGGELSVVLSEARHLPSFSPACSVRYSCRVGRQVVVNDDRWRSGSRPFSGPLAQYRAMVVNHETGHWLGLGHVGCPRAGTPAPVMQQQSKGLQGCLPNAWPLAGEVASATPRR